jgi:YHS domain-containing protein
LLVSGKLRFSAQPFIPPKIAERICKDCPRPTTNKQMKQFSALLLAVGLAFSASAQTKTLLNLNKSGVAIQGYDPVAFFTDHAPVKGKPQFGSKYNGAVYEFASQQHKDLFDRDPAKYEPAFGGYCAYGVSRDKLVSIDVDAFQIVDGKLLLQYSKGVRDDFNEDRKGNLSKANQNWPGLVDRKGK